jgi:hypothetical protein
MAVTEHVMGRKSRYVHSGVAISYSVVLRTSIHLRIPRVSRPAFPLRERTKTTSFYEAQIMRRSVASTLKCD